MIATRKGHAGLRWQSWVPVILVIPFCAASAARYSAITWDTKAAGGLLAGLALGMVVWRARAATPLAALSGGVIATVMIFSPLAPSAGVLLEHSRWRHSALLPFLTLLLLTLAATRFGKERKESLGVAEDGRGRDAAQVVANLGVAAAVAATALLPRELKASHARLLAILVVAALAEATADTLSSEMGEVLGGRPFLITTGMQVPPGTDGAMSWAGTVAGAAGGALVVLVGAVALRLGPGSAFAAWAGAIAGLLFDSLLGATAESRGWLNNDAVNFLSTVAASLAAVVLERALS